MYARWPEDIRNKARIGYNAVDLFLALYSVFSRLRLMIRDRNATEIAKVAKLVSKSIIILISNFVLVIKDDENNIMTAVLTRYVEAIHFTIADFAVLQPRENIPFLEEHGIEELG